MRQSAPSHAKRDHSGMRKGLSCLRLGTEGDRSVVRHRPFQELPGYASRMASVSLASDPVGVQLVAPLQQAPAGSSGSFLVLADDGRRYWCKGVFNLQHPRVPHQRASRREAWTTG